MWDRFFSQFKQAIEPRGRVWEYFRTARDEQRNWEYELRDNYKKALQGSDLESLKKYVEDLGIAYNAGVRWMKPHKRKLGASAIALKLNVYKLQFSKGRGLLDSETSVVNILEKVYDEIVCDTQKAIGKNMKSWTSKALHFSFPPYFPLYDSLADLAWTTVIQNIPLKVGKETYSEICMLYIRLWDGLSKYQDLIRERVKKINTEFSLSDNFTILDAFDKHFWKIGKEVEKETKDNKLSEIEQEKHRFNKIFGES